MDPLVYQKTARKNYYLYILAATLRSVAMLCAGGSLMQAFLLAAGMSDTRLYIHSAVYQAANVLTILLGSRCADRGNITRRVAFYSLPHIALFLCYLPLCLSDRASGLFWLLLLVGTLQAVVAGFLTVFEYKLPYYVFDPRDYGSFTAIFSALTYAIQMLIGFLMTWLSGFFAYERMMLVGFIAAAAMIALSIVAHWFMKSLIPLDTEQKKRSEKEAQVPMREVFGSRVFLTLLPAHLLRGFAYGTTTVITIICASLGFGESVISSMVSVQAAAMLIGSLLFGIMVRYMSARIPLFIGTLLFLPIPLVLLHNEYAFLIVTFLVLFGRALVDCSVPVLLLRAVPVRIAGPYNAFRMALHLGGALIATSIATVLPTSLLILLTLIAQILSAALYLCAKSMREW